MRNARTVTRTASNAVWNDKATSSSKEIIDLVVDLISDKDYDALSEAIIASYLETKQKGDKMFEDVLYSNGVKFVACSGGWYEVYSVADGRLLHCWLGSLATAIAWCE